MAADEIVMEKLVEELQFQIPFKEQTETGDVTLMLREGDDGRVSMSYARVLGFDRDTTKRDEWWHVHFLFLEMPPVPRTIILQTPHFTGQEIFTMGGRKVFIKALNFQTYYEEMTGFHEPEDDGDGGDKGGGPSPGPSDKKPSGGGKPTFTLVK
ncbi:hypothetical protein C4J81_06265 [Deltaproteobacteria bacterium Smac51]|nr:hypothetical protein C4J81_06265 [Deltaproteobacteria bacterium Smac51]